MAGNELSRLVRQDEVNLARFPVMGMEELDLE